MGKFSFVARAARYMVLVALALGGIGQHVWAAADLPLASGSDMAGIGFDDKPLVLPVQRNFQMAMLTAGSELGRSCGKMEAYGWRMAQTEQARVDQIFNTTVDRLRGLGYVVEMQTPNAVSKDITMFTADKPNRHLLSMWSAGEIGLVMVMCETSAPPTSRLPNGSAAIPSVQNFSQDVLRSNLNAPLQENTAKASYEKFTPVGVWAGSYICGQGYTGATLTIAHLHGDSFDGNFHFYPTARNPSVPEGRYEVFGQYDRASQRILVNPGKWLQRPRDFYNTIIVGSFDVMSNSLSAYFQGINGCTSFEARRDKNAAVFESAVHKKAAKKHTKAAVKKAAKPALVEAPVLITAPAADATSAAAGGVQVGTSAAAPSAPPAIAPPAPVASSAPAAPAAEKPPLVVGAPTPGAVPASTVVPAPAGTTAPAAK